MYPYLETMVGFGRTITKTTNRVSTGARVLDYTNNKNIDGPNIRIGAGYMWPEDDENWSWGLGGRLGYNRFALTGQGNFGTPRLRYKYRIAMVSFAIIGRVVHRDEWWKSYGTFSLGVSRLRNDQYKAESRGIADFFRNKTQRNMPFYAASLGVVIPIPSICKNMDVGLEVGVADTNKKASLGQNHRRTVVGSVRQRARILNAGLSFIYNFSASS